MILSFFFIFTDAVLPKCIASTKISNISSEYDIIQYQVVINSGFHTPKKAFLSREKRGFWYCDSQSAYSPRTNAFPMSFPRSIHSIVDKRYSEYPPNCYLNDLTVEGMNQIHNLGLNYRKYLLSYDTNYFSDANISQKINVRAANDDNSFINAISFLSGFFNDEKIDDLEIITGTKSKEKIIPDKKYCKDTKKLIENFESSDECQNIISKAVNDLKPILKYLNYSKEELQSLTRSQLISICDFIISMHCNGQVTDYNVTDDLIDKISSYYSKLSFNPFFLASKSKIGVAASTIMREIIRTINKTIENKSSIKFSLLSADDSTIAAILSLLKHKRVIIPYSSHISICILKKSNSYYLQVALNGNPLELPTIEKTIFSYNDFLNYVNNYIDFCHELP